MSRGERASHQIALEVRDLRHRFGASEALRGIDLEIAAGETFGLLGPNGAGKTTMLSVLATQLAPSAGLVSVFGHDLLRDPGAIRGRIGLAPQRLSLYPNLSGVENLRFFGALYGLRGATLRSRCEQCLALVGLTPRGRDRVATYSGGMQRRLNLACAIVHEPRILLLDEPTTGVDPQSRESLLGAVQEMSAEGVTIVYTTHYIEEAEKVCDRIAILDEGRVVACGTRPELLETVGLGEIVEIRGLRLSAHDPRVARLPGVRSVTQTRAGTRLMLESAIGAIGELAELVQAEQSPVEGVEIYPVDLERVFIHLTGRALRD